VIDGVHQTRSKSSRNGTQHSAICYAQNHHLPSLSWFQSATVHVSNGSLSLTLTSMEWKPMDSITGISYCLRNVSHYQTHCSKNYFLGKQHITALCMPHSPTAAAKNSILLLLSYAPPQQCIAEPYWLPDLCCSLSISWVNMIDKNKKLLAESWKAVILYLSENMSFLCFYVLLDSAETLYRRGEKIYQLFIAQSLGNICAKNCNCESQIMFARVTARNVRDPFLRRTELLWIGICLLLDY